MTTQTATQITIKETRRYNANPDPDRLFDDLPHEVPANVPADADSWFVASLWEADTLMYMATGWTERDAVREIFVALNTAAIDAMLIAAKVL